LWQKLERLQKVLEREAIDFKMQSSAETAQQRALDFHVKSSGLSMGFPPLYWKTRVFELVQRLFRLQSRKCTNCALMLFKFHFSLCTSTNTFRQMQLYVPTIQRPDWRSWASKWSSTSFPLFRLIFKLKSVQPLFELVFMAQLKQILTLVNSRQFGGNNMALDYYPNSSMAAMTMFMPRRKGWLCENMLVDETDGRFRYFIIDTGFWVFGRKYCSRLARIDYDDKHVYGAADQRASARFTWIWWRFGDQQWLWSLSSVSGNINSGPLYNADPYDYDQEPYFYNYNDQNLRLYEELRKKRNRSGADILKNTSFPDNQLS